MKLKLDENGNAVLSDGKPVYVHDDGKEAAFDAPGTVATISKLNAEAKSHRESKEEALNKLKAFEGIEDPKAAIYALQKLKSIDQQKLVDAGEVDKVRKEIADSYESKLSEYKSKAEQLEQSLYAEKVGGSFARSKLIAEKLAIPADMVQARFGSQFKVEDGQVVGFDSQGQKLYSREKPGELASFDEALDLMVSQYEHKDHILKSSGSTGSGAKPSHGTPNQKTVSRQQFDSMPHAERATFAKEGGKVIDD